MMAVLEKTGHFALGVACIGFIFYLRYRWAMDVELPRHRKSDLQGFLRKIDSGFRSATSS
jgi:hypothetical protein